MKEVVQGDDLLVPCEGRPSFSLGVNLKSEL